MNKYRIDVYIADDHTMFAEGLADALNHSDSVHVSRTFHTLAECRTAIAERRPDVLLLDIAMPDGNGPDFCRWVVSTYTRVKVIAVSMHNEYSVVQRMLDAGAHGYVLKSAPIGHLLKAIGSAWQGRRILSPEVERIVQVGSEESVPLSAVEKHILKLICDGLTNREIALQVSLSTETVNWYRKRLLAKFGKKNVAGLVAHVVREKIL